MKYLNKILSRNKDKDTKNFSGLEKLINNLVRTPNPISESPSIYQPTVYMWGERKGNQKGRKKGGIRRNKYTGPCEGDGPGYGNGGGRGKGHRRKD